MKKLVTVLALTLLFFSSTLPAQHLVSTEVELRNPVVYDFTGIHCVSCPKAHTAIAVAREHYPQLVAIAFHTGQYAQPNPGEPDYRTLEGDYIYNVWAYYNPLDELYNVVWAFPTVAINGTGVENSTVNDTTAFLEEIALVAAEEAVVNVAALATIDTLTRNLKVEVECYYTSAAADSNYLVISVTQNGLMSAQSGAPQSGDEYVHKDMFRMYVTNILGDTLGQPQAGDLIQKTYNMVLPDSICFHSSDPVVLSLRDIEIQAYITGGDTTVTAYDFFQNAYPGRKAYEILNGVNATKEYIYSSGISSPAAEAGITVYPNPARDFIYIKPAPGDHFRPNSSLHITDLSGRRVFEYHNFKSSETNGLYVPLKGIKTGIYLIRVNDGGTYSTTKFIVK